MSRKDNKIQYYLDEDYLFLTLKLLDYPKMERGEFTFDEIKAENYKRAAVSKIFYDIANFRNQGLLKIENFKLNNSDYATTKTLILAMVKFPKHKLSLTLNKIINNNFNFYDLEIVSSYKCNDQVFNLIDFDIKISRESKQIITDALQKYLKLFADEEIESPKKNYLRIEFQKENIKKKIDEISRKTRHSLVLKSSDFNNEHRFLESILLLERERFLIIKNISSEKNREDLFNYLINCESREKRYSHPPFYVIKKDMGFLKFSKNGKAIKIGKTDSQHFRLLKLLLKPFRKKNGINYVFEKIETKRIKKYPESDLDDQMRKLEYVVKELQKKKRLGGLLKITLDKEMETIWIDYTK